MLKRIFQLLCAYGQITLKWVLMSHFFHSGVTRIRCSLERLEYLADIEAEESYQVNSGERG